MLARCMLCCLVFCVLGVLALSGCGEPELSADADPNTLTFRTGAFEVPPGDVFECFYTDVTTDRQLSVQSATARQAVGGHHVTVYYTNVPQPPNHHPCRDEEMVEWQQVAGAGGDEVSGEGTVSLPDGLATRIPAGKQIVTQSHYINTTGRTITVEDTVSIRLVDPSRIRAYANYFVVNDATFQVPAGMRTERTTTCTVPQDLQIVLLLGHMHANGRHYRLERLHEGEPAELLYETGWQPVYESHPPITRFPVERPYLLPQGARLRQTCRWDNDTGQPLVFPREMCIAFMYYFPDMGSLFCRDVRPVQ